MFNHLWRRLYVRTVARATCNARVSFLLNTEEREEIFFPVYVDVDVIYRPILEAEKGPALPPISWKP